MKSYTGKIKAGDIEGSSSEYNVLYDTGSEDVFLFDQSCKTEDCIHHNKYKKGKAFKFIKKNDSLAVILYNLVHIWIS